MRELELSVISRRRFPYMAPHVEANALTEHHVSQALGNHTTYIASSEFTYTV